ncbi:MAG TPA: MgtC/SapB family protein [Gemmatimonadales bacterium]|nr:MgtC/SapB family protein [Gemmatimonadales bacterium]
MPVQLPETAEIVLRLGAATVVGGALGINRELRHKSAGLRTLALVALGAAMAAIVITMVAGGDSSAASRALQGVLTGIGFLGAGVILHPSQEPTVIGLTTAASVWVVAVLGFACGLGAWAVAAAGTVLVLVVLVLGSYLEDAMRRRWPAPRGH